MKPALDLSEAELVKRLAAGDESVFSALVRSLHGRLLRLARALVSSPPAAEGLVLDTWTAVLSELGTFEVGAGFEAWVFRLLAERSGVERATNGSAPVGTDIHRQRANAGWTAARGIGGGSDGVSRPPPSMVGTTEAPVLMEVLASLPPLEHAVVLLRDVEGFDLPQVAAILALEPGREGALLHRARAPPAPGTIFVPTLGAGRSSAVPQTIEMNLAFDPEIQLTQHRARCPSWAPHAGCC